MGDLQRITDKSWQRMDQTDKVKAVLATGIAVFGLAISVCDMVKGGAER